MVKILVAILLIYKIGFGFTPKKPEEALKQIYPSSTIEVKNIVIPHSVIEKLQRDHNVKLDSRIVTFYIVKKDGKVIAYGYVDIHTVRTKPEAVLYTITPDGKIDIVEVLAFNEPLEYLPEESWFKQFSKKDENSLKFKKDIQNLTGATLTSRAITENGRKAIILWKTIFGEGS
ncbi:MAG: FMN-binding protein [Hydrogenothermaceae bacterium]